MIDIKDILTLSDGNQYGVVNKTIKNNIIYYYLVDTKNPANIKFCYEEKNNNQIELVEIEDKVLIKSLLLDFVNNIQLDF